MSEDRRAKQRAASLDYHRRMQSDPEYRAKKAAKAKAWREANPERFKAAKKKCYEARRDHYLGKTRAWYKNNPERALQNQRAWRAANPEAVRVWNQARRAREAEGDLTLAEWREILEEFDYRCAYCQSPEDIELEHMTPLARGGRHSKENVVPACGDCNGRKNSKTIFEFLAVA